MELCQTILVTAKHIESEEGSLWSRAAGQQRFKCWETKAAETRAEAPKHLPEALQGLHLAQSVPSDPTDKTVVRQDVEVERSTSMTGQRPATANPGGRVGSSEIPQAVATTGSDLHPAIARSPHPVIGKSKPDAVLLHEANRLFVEDEEDLEKTDKKKYQSLLWSDIRLTIEAKKGTRTSDFEIAVGDALVRALRIKDTWNFTGNVYCIIVANAQLTFLCVNAGKIVEMPMIDAQKSPIRFIRALLTATSHGACHDHWTADISPRCSPAFLNPTCGNTIDLLPLSGVETLSGNEFTIEYPLDNSNSSKSELLKEEEVVQQRGL
ncbi:unnamed protein product [Sympodiomycopsis kandeliae]